MISNRRKEIISRQISEFDDEWNHTLDCIKQRPSQLIASEFNEVLRVVSQAVAANFPREQIVKYLHLLADLGVANFVSSLNPGKTISLPIGDARIEVVGEATTAYMDVHTWLIGFFASVVGGKLDSNSLLFEVPEDAFLRANIKPNAFDLAVVRASKGLFDPSANIGQLLVDAMEASDERNIEPNRLDYAWSIMLPFLMLYRIAVAGDPDNEYDQLFEDGLEQHRYIWQTEERKSHPEGWFSLPLTAAAVMIFDSKGIRYSKDTSLVPRWMVEELRQ